MKNKIKEILDTYGFYEIFPLCVKQIQITEAVRAACAKNDCGNYGKNYMCPPDVGDLQTCKQKIETYNDGFIFSQVHFIKERKEYKQYDNIIKGFAGVSDKLAREIYDKRLPAAVYSAGGCSLCKKCAILTEEPCRFPDIAIPSMEASGVDVVSLSKATGLTYNNGTNSITIIGMILY